MSQKTALLFRPALESLDGRVLPSSLNLTTSDGGQVTRGQIEPVADKNGDLWLCRETDNSCECIPFPG